MKNFFLSALVDFPDDCINEVYTPESLDKMVGYLAGMGVRRLYWQNYGDIGYGGFWAKGEPRFVTNHKTALAMNDPNAYAAKAAHKHGMEFCVIIKPYETGVSMVYPEGSPEAREFGILPHLDGWLGCVMDFVRDHPEYRIARRTDDIPEGQENAAIDKIELYKCDDRPTRIRRENLEIWVSGQNCKYQKADIDFDFCDEVVPAYRTFRDFNGGVLAEINRPVRRLTLSGLGIKDKYCIVTTNFDTSAGGGDFKNSAVDMARAYGEDGKEIVISVGRNYNLWYYAPPQAERGCFDNGVSYDDAFGNMQVCLDEPKTDWRQGFIALTRGRNRYLPVALCESYPEVSEFWLKQVREVLEIGADMIDFRIENHCCHTDDPYAYGYNDVVIEEYRRRYGNAPVDVRRVAEIRGENYTRFLREAKKIVNSFGKKMHHHLNVEYFREEPPYDRRMAYPWNMRIEWEKWLEEGLLDEATLRTFTFTPAFVLNDPFSLRVVDMCKRHGVPVNYNRYINGTPESYRAEYDLVKSDGRFQTFIVYEVATLMESDGKDGIKILKPELCDAISRFEQPGL